MRSLWAHSEVFDARTREAVLNMTDEEAASAFSGELTFGTGGLRGVLGAGTARMNEYTVARATQGLAEAIKARGGSKVVISHDSRRMSPRLARVTAGVLARAGVRCLLFSRLMPTPVLSYAVRALKADAGVMITASHNPAEYNGYKVYGADGCQITQDAARDITSRIQETPYETLGWMDEAEARARGLLRDVPDAVVEQYVQDTCALRARPQPITIKVMYTPLHGAGLEPVLAVSRAMGFMPCVVDSQREPDGAFPTCPKPNPEYRAALAPGIEAMERERADILIATDPDSDRVGVVARGADGEARVLTGNEIGLLLLDDILCARVRAGTMPNNALVVKTIVTTDLAFEIAKAYDVSVREVLTGFKYIGETIGELETGGEAERFLFGFEESCGYLCGTHVRDKDGVQAYMLLVDMAQRHSLKGHTLPEAMDALYARYGFMAHALLDYSIQSVCPMDDMRARMASLRAHPPLKLCGRPVTRALDYRDGLDGLPPEDVLSYACGDALKLIVRPSGTEPKIKAYLSVRDADRERARRTLEALKAEANKLLGEGEPV